VILAYFAHPVGAPTQAGVDANIQSAMQWYRWACDTFPDRAFNANWIVDVLVYHGTDILPNVSNGQQEEHEARIRGLMRDDRVIDSCEEFWMFGGRISTGVQRGLDRAKRHGERVFDFNQFREPPLGFMPVTLENFLL
jgi:hypothetical protein